MTSADSADSRPAISEEARAMQRRFAAAPATEPAPIEEMRTAAEAWAQLGRPPVGIEVTDIDADGVPAEWIVVPPAPADRALVYVHGGSFTMGSPRTHRHLAAHLAVAAGCPALVLDYRLAPEHTFPAALDDIVVALTWLAREMRIAPARTVLVGDSAGGNLVLGAAVRARDDHRDPLAGVVAISACTDLTGSAPSMRDRAHRDPVLGAGGQADRAREYLARNYAMYAGDAELTHPWLSPLFADPVGLAPLLLHVGEEEILLDDTTRLAERVRTAGGEIELVVWPGMHHAFPMSVGIIPEADAAVAAIGRWIAGRQAAGEA